MTGAASPRATLRDVFAVREFRTLWLSDLSVAGDRLALVALTLLVCDRTKSPLLAAAVYAAGYLPWVIGGLFLAEVADRRARRSVMVVCDAVRAAPGSGHGGPARADLGPSGTAVCGDNIRASV